MSGKRGPNASSVRTKATILDAALSTLRDEGIADTSARAIARAGDFNQALIFYHFGSVDDALVAAFEQLLARQRNRYDASLAAVQTVAELRSGLVHLMNEDLASGVTTTIAQGFAGATHRPHMGPKLRAAVRDWLEVIELAAVRVGVSVADARLQVSAFMSLYIGYEVFSGLSRGDIAEGSGNAVDVELLTLALGGNEASRADTAHRGAGYAGPAGNRLADGVSVGDVTLV